MAQYGLVADSQGVKTAPETVQQVFASLYSNAADCPVVGGGVVSGRADLAYSYTAGVGLIKTSAGAYYVTWEAGQTGLVTAPSSGTVTDWIYADADGVVRVQRGSEPAGVCILDARTVPAGATATTGTTSIYDRVWAISRGQGPDKLAEYIDTASNGQAAAEGPFDWATLTFDIAYDYDLRVQIDSNLAVRGAGSLDNNVYTNPIGSALYTLYLDGVQMDTREMAYSRIYELKQTTIYLPGVTAGRHTIKVVRQHLWGATGEHHLNGRGRCTVYRDSMVA